MPERAKTEDPHDGAGLVHAYILDGQGGGKSIGWAEVEQWKPADGVLWVNIDYSHLEAAEWMKNEAGLDPLAIEALLDHDPRPRAAVMSGSLMLIVRGINVNAGAVLEDMLSVRCWFAQERVITMRRRRSRSVQSIATDLSRGVGPKTPAELLAMLVDRIVDHVSTHVDALGDDVAAMEDQVLTEAKSHDLRSKVADQRRRAIALRRFLAPQREALGRLAAIELPWLDAVTHGHIVHDADRMARVVEELDAARDRATVTQEELQTQQAELTNQRLYVLSIMTAIFLPLGFVCALLGVNVGGIPFQKDDWAFWALCGMFAVGVGIQLWIFKIRGWLGRL